MNINVLKIINSMIKQRRNKAMIDRYHKIIELTQKLPLLLSVKLWTRGLVI